MKTHPDKTNQNDDFIIIQSAFENKDLLQLIEYANKYNIYKDINLSLLTLILEKEVFNIKNKVKTLKTTIGYQILINNTKCITDLILIHKENEKFRAETEKNRIARFRF